MICRWKLWVTSQNRTGQVRSGQVRSGQVRSDGLDEYLTFEYVYAPQEKGFKGTKSIATTCRLCRLKVVVFRCKWFKSSTHRVKEGGVAQHVEGWRDMHFKGSSGWYNQLAEQHWDNITEDLNKAKSTFGGDDTLVDEVEVLERSLGQRRGHVRGVGRKVKSITPDLPPHMYAPEANARWAEQQRINGMMQQQINKLMSMQGGQSSSSPYYPGFEQNQDQDQDEDNESD
ncbi:hypothetical protein R6Q57_014475 [Mikania cordata]